MKVIDYIKKRGLPVLDDSEYRKTIELWWHWYQGYVEEAHGYYVRTTALKKKKFRRYTLGMAKTICEDYATLLLNEKVKITAKGFEKLDGILEDNCFLERANRLVEITMALGTGAFVEYKDSDDTKIDYLRADMIFPMKWDGDTITECTFASILENGIDEIAKKLFYVQIHTRRDDGMYVVENVFLDDKGREQPTPENIKQFSDPSPVPLFQIIRPNAYNSIDPYTPMGMSVYGAALPQLAGADIVYDSFVNEFLLGKKRILVPQTMAQVLIKQNEDGTEKLEPYFDPTDAVFHTYQTKKEDSDDTIKEIDFRLRVEEHNIGIQRALDILSKKCGLGAKRYRFDGDGNPAKTATEIISENSDLYQSMKRNEKPLERAIIGMVQALSYLSGGNAEIDVAVEFDDSIIEDENATIQKNILLINSGLQSKLRAIMDVFKVDETEAKRRLQDIASEQTVSPDAVDLLMSGERQ